MENKFEIKITDAEGEGISLNLHRDSDIYDWVRIFKIILKWVTFSENQINEILPTDEEL